MTQRVAKGQVLGGRFRLRRALATDPLLEVWHGEDLELRRDVVVKVLAPRWMVDQRMVERFTFEATAAARLEHDNVASTFTVEHTDGVLYTVSEYLDGPTVEELVAAGPLPAPAVAAIGQQAASGLAAAHADNLLHRAICPQNLVVAPNGRLCIIDFGSVRAIEGEDHHLPDPVFPEPAVTNYWPPERHAGLEVDERGDVYSLGLVMWEALTGAPQVGDTSAQRPVRRLMAGLPGGDAETPRLRQVLAEATDGDREQRPSAAELEAALAGIFGTRPQDVLHELVTAVREGGGDA